MINVTDLLDIKLNDTIIKLYKSNIIIHIIKNKA